MPDTSDNRAAALMVIAIGEPAVNVATATCSGSAQPGVGTRSVDVAAAPSARAGLVASTPKAVAVSGLTGRQLDVSLEPGWTTSTYRSPSMDEPE